MTQQHPITPPPELVEQWFAEQRRKDGRGARYSVVEDPIGLVLELNINAVKTPNLLISI